MRACGWRGKGHAGHTRAGPTIKTQDCAGTQGSAGIAPAGAKGNAPGFAPALLWRGNAVARGRRWSAGLERLERRRRTATATSRLPEAARNRRTASFPAKLTASQSERLLLPVLPISGKEGWQKNDPQKLLAWARGEESLSTSFQESCCHACGDAACLGKGSSCGTSE